MHMSSACPRAGVDTRAKKGDCKVEDFPHGWGNLIRQSPQGQVLLSEKPRDIHLI